jgi:hypothetical protein
MSTIVKSVIIEAERASAREFMRALSHEEGLRVILREERLRAAMQAAARQADMRRVPVHQEPWSAHQNQARQDSELHVADSGRVVRVGGMPTTINNSPGRPDPHVAGPTQVGGGFITNNTPGRPDVTMVGRSRPTKPIRLAKSKIVPEPDQIKSAPPRRSSPLEPPGS